MLHAPDPLEATPTSLQWPAPRAYSGAGKDLKKKKREEEKKTRIVGRKIRGGREAKEE